MSPDRKYAIQNGAAVGLGLFAWEVGKELMMEPLGRTAAVFGSGVLAAIIAGTIHWFIGKMIRTK